MSIISIIDYGLGNLRSVINMFNRLEVPAQIICTAQEIMGADTLVLPGVGSFDSGMDNLQKRGMIRALFDRVIAHKKPLLGICLGMQLMGKGSEEGMLPGLGFLDMHSIRFKFDDNNLKVPHMGWSHVEVVKNSGLFDGLEKKSRFYFVHSYHAVCDDANDVAATAEYGAPFVAAVQHDAICGCQFHPEKSHRYGMKLLANFAKNIATP